MSSQQASSNPLYETLKASYRAGRIPEAIWAEIEKMNKEVEEYYEVFYRPKEVQNDPNRDHKSV